MKSKVNVQNLKKYMTDITEILKGEECLKKYKTAFCIFLLIAIFLELFVFNFRAVESCFNSRIDVGNYSTSGASEISDGTYRVNSGEVSFEISSINEKLKNVLIDIDTDSAYTKVQLWAVDKANALGISAPEREIVTGLKQTKYIRTHFSGDVKRFKITLKNMESGSQFTINDIAFNVKVPVCFSILRFLFVLGVMMLLYTFRPKSFVYKYTVDLKKNWQRAAVAALVVVQIICLWGICHVNPALKNPPWENHQQYNDLAEAFLDGNTYIKYEPSKELMELENPYDTGLRNAESVAHQWDRAFYNGHYYVYFGVVPVLLYYLPYRILTGQNLLNYIVVFMNCSLTCMILIALLYSVIRKWFKRTSFGVFILTAIIVMDTCGMFYIAKRPDLYLVPIVTAIMFAAAGLTLWINSEKIDENGKKYLRTPCLALGAICMSLIGGCRPHILLTTVFGVIFFWKAVFKERILFSKSSIKNTVALCLPYVIIGGGLMIYNYIRFGSPFDFGANYNITTNDMTARGVVMDRNLTGIFYYFLHPLSVTNTFPYVQMIKPQSLYQGFTTAEIVFGGLLWVTPLTLLGIRGLWKRKWYDKTDMRPYAILCAAVIMSVVIGVIDAQVAGILVRYCSDFSWIMLFGAAIALFAEYNYAENERTQNILTQFLLVCFIISVTIAGLHIFNDGDNGVMINNPELYYKMKYLIGFLV